jgi:hypothetical protein
LVMAATSHAVIIMPRNSSRWPSCHQSYDRSSTKSKKAFRFLKRWKPFNYWSSEYIVLYILVNSGLKWAQMSSERRIDAGLFCQRSIEIRSEKAYNRSTWTTSITCLSYMLGWVQKTTPCLKITSKISLLLWGNRVGWRSWFDVFVTLISVNRNQKESSTFQPFHLSCPFDCRTEYRVNKSSYSWVGFNSKGRNRNWWRTTV